MSNRHLTQRSIDRTHRGLRFAEGAMAVVLVLGLTLLIAGCARFTYDDTPTPVPYIPPPLTSTSIVATTIPLPTPTAQGRTMLRMEPPVLNLTVGETHLMQVWLDNVERLHSIELHLGFEPGYVRIEDADPDTEGVQIGEGVIPVPAQVMRNTVDNEAGLIVYQVAQAPGSPVSGSGLVASFTVRALADGGSPLRFNVATFRDPEGQALPAPEQVDGLVIIGPGDTTPEPTTQAVPTETPPAETPTAGTPVEATPTPSPVPIGPPPTAGIYYTVQPGENLFRIALRYGTTVDAVVAANNLPDRSSVQAGQVLLIPVSPPAGTTAYVVQPGDTLYSIARRFSTTAEMLAALNGIAPPYTIKVGQMLIIVP